MTKVILTQAVLNYRRGMVELVRKTVKENYIRGVNTYHSPESIPAIPHLLPSPKVEIIELTDYQGQIGDPIFFATSDDFGMSNLYVVIRDDQGNVIESGDAAQFDDCSDCWDYRATVSVPSGTSVTVYAIATDSLWGAGALSARLTLL
jgi:hypothetical protein